MRVSCVICGELYLQNQDVSATPCGHTFHTLCIIQWLERSKSCPQCRDKATERTLKKLYFNTANADDEADPDALQQQIDNLKFQLKLKEQETKKATDKVETLTAQSAALREGYKSSREIIRNKDTTIVALKSQLTYLDKASSEAKKAKDEVHKLKEHIKLLKGVEKLVSGTTEEVKMMVSSVAGSNDNTLAHYCNILKQELSKALHDQGKLRNETQAAQRKCKQALEETKDLKETVNSLNSTVLYLEEDNESLEVDNRNLKKKIETLEHAISSPSDDVRNSALHRLLFESPAPDLLKRLYSADNCDSVTPEVVRKRPKTTSESLEVEEEEEKGKQESGNTNMIDLVTPPRKGHSMKKTSSSTLNPFSGNHNIMKGSRDRYSAVLQVKASTSSSWKDRKLKGSGVGYDGMGGHHQVDEFPRPGPLLAPVNLKKKAGNATKKKVVQETGKTKKLSDYFKNTFED